MITNLLRTLDVLEGCRKSLDGAFREFSNCRALHKAPWVDVQEASRRHSVLKRKAEDAHETWDHVKAEEVLNDSLGCLGTLVKDTAGRHSRACVRRARSRVERN